MIEITPIININKKDDEILDYINTLNNMFDNETAKMNKVAYMYKNIKTGEMFTYNNEVLFYAASTVKILACLYYYELADKGLINLNEKVLITMDDLKQDTGVIKYQKEDTYYTYYELLELSITESDNTAYIKLVELIGVDKYKEYGLSMGAKHTLEGKDLFGLINCEDMVCYWTYLNNYLNTKSKNALLFKTHLENPSEVLIKDSTLDGNIFIRKFGSYDIAYHEAGIVNDEFIMIILTQLNKMDYKEMFINASAEMIININKLLK